jgi:prepilin-type N-terminal cleavage/methylation domain-containing protein
VLSKLKSKASGFTLIEVVIVLAIAGLIMVVVFLAVGGAQRGRRDTERSNAAARLIAAAEQTMANNGGTVPANCAAVLGFNPGGYVCAAAAPTAATASNIWYRPNVDCTGAAAPRTIAASYWVESTNAVGCVDTN